jgi:hypothetical protein
MTTTNLTNMTTRKVQHGQLILDGVCSDCGHCGQKLTDANSVERGLGPICSRKGYQDVSVSSADPLEALISLSAYPEVVAFLTTHYHDGTVGRLMNGLVRLCSLNRRTQLHSDCCEAIELLGYKRLASTLRESLSRIHVKQVDETTLSLKIRYADLNWSFLRELRALPGVRYDAVNKLNLFSVSVKREVWELLKRHYAGFHCRCPSGTVRIPESRRTN